MVLAPSSSKIHLKSTLKHTTSSDFAITRILSTEDTLSKIVPICTKMGVTRISDITFMDRLYIPNYSAVLPGTEDLFWVYGGKGATRANARASALMEAIERYSSLPGSYPRCFIHGSYSELSNSYEKVLHPAEVVEPTDQKYDDKKTIMDFLFGYDLLTNQTVLVPAELALYRYFPKHNAFSYSHTNGLASGNVLEEAVCHALCEVIERDAVSIADLSASCIPYYILEQIVDLLNNREKCTFTTDSILKDKFVDNSSIFQDVDISNFVAQFGPIRRIVNRFAEAGIPLLVKDITQKDIGIPTFLASSIEWITKDYGYFAKGFGTHPDARIALLRAITEVSQTRAINIQGARDDLKKINYRENDDIYKRKWQFMSATSSSRKGSNQYKSTIEFSQIKTYVNEDILCDIQLILSKLKNAGLKRAIIVDLTDPSMDVPVVRAIVPGLETFEVTNSIMGRRAKEFFKMIHHAQN
jgi:thioglycine synthase